MILLHLIFTVALCKGMGIYHSVILPFPVFITHDHDLQSEYETVGMNLILNISQTLSHLVVLAAAIEHESSLQKLFF